MHLTPVSIPQAPHNITLAYVQSQRFSFTYSTQTQYTLNLQLYKGAWERALVSEGEWWQV